MQEIYYPTGLQKSALKIISEHFKTSGDGVFFTIQGEGKNIGKPSVFFRLHFCNLECSWCDTKYAWNKEMPEFWKESDDWDFERTISEISKYPARRLVITGGEPLIQQRTIAKFLEEIPDWDVEIETNGTIFPYDGLVDRCQFNVSPKLNNSSNPRSLRYKPHVLKRLNEGERTTFKFVVQKDGDLDEVSLIAEDCGLDNEKIIIMPEGIDMGVIKENSLAVIEGVKARGWTFCPRLQYFLLWKE